MDIALKRLNRISDLVFAAAMTIMILLFQLPTEDDLSTKESFELYLGEAFPTLIFFLITFTIVTIYWVKDVGQFKYIQRTDNTHTWLQMGSLAFLLLLPWTNALLEINPDHLTVRILYCLIIFMTGLFSSLAWHYASKNNRLVDKDLDKKQVFTILEINLTEPIVALIAIFIAILWPDFFMLSFILIPLLYSLQKKIRHKIKEKKMRQDEN